MAVTSLLKESQKQNRKAYQSGYSQCLQDLWQFVQQRGVQQPTAEHPTGQTMVSVVDLALFLRSKHEEMQASSRASSRAPEESGRADNMSETVSGRVTHPETSYQPDAQLDPQTPQQLQSTQPSFNPPEPRQPSHQVPQSQFTFSVSTPPRPDAHTYQPSFSSEAESSPGFGPTESLKRRWNDPLTFFGRTIGMDGRDMEPPSFKRTRYRRDDRMMD